MYLEKIKKEADSFLNDLKSNQTEESNIKNRVLELARSIETIKAVIPASVCEQFIEFFDTFYGFNAQCLNYEYFVANIEMMESSLELFVECIGEIQKECPVKRCTSCNKEVRYLPLVNNPIQNVSGKVSNIIEETINKEEYYCPVCGASDRDRLIVSFLKKNGLQQAAEGTKVLQFAPAKVITNWILSNCPHLDYQTTDLYMDGVTYHSDIQDMSMIQDNTYDVIINSHVLEHVQDDRKAMQEMKRILKDDGKIIFLVPVNLNGVGIDEEWGLSEEENRKRFGQEDHCRRYSKSGLLERLKDFFEVRELGKKYFGEEVFRQCGLTDTSTLYILTKSKEVSLDLSERVAVDKELCESGPLVSVILPCYNHEECVADAIESVIAQTYKNIEILVADDASTDNTVAVIKKYSSYLAKELYYKENKGGRELELKAHAAGKYIALMHSDDIWEPDKIALQVDYMEKNPECRVCLTWCKYVDDNLKEFADNTFVKANRSSYEWMRFFWEDGNALCNPSSLIRRENAWDFPKYGTICRQLPDFFKWVYEVQKGSIHIIPKVLIRMRRFENMKNVSAGNKANIYRHLIEEGSSWLWIIRDMSTEFFIKAFSGLMVNPQATTKEQIQCEKYFLLLKHRNMFVQNSAFAYINEIFGDVRETLEKEYHYTKRDIANDMINKGLAKIE